MKKTIVVAVAASACLSVCSTLDLGAQTKPMLAPADYGRFESLAPQGGGLSPDGRWLAYGITRSNRSNELRVVSVADGTTTTIAFASQPVFSADSRWVAYGIGMSEAQED